MPRSRPRPDSRVAFDPEERCDRALKRALEALREVIVRNEAGVVADLDPEFNHRYRVAMRRTRSALGQVRKVFPVRAVTRFKRGFAWLGSVTGPPRDLDVLLIRIAAAREADGALSQEERAGLGPLLTVLRDEKHRRHQCMAHAFESARYRRLLGGWRDFLAAELPVRTSLANAQRPVNEVARERIWKAYRRCVKHGRAITAQSPIEALHRLRIDGKKLRYLLELFAPLLPACRREPLIRPLKNLQDHLGDLHDCAVQRETLRKVAAELVMETPRARETRRSIDALLRRITERESTERGGATARLELFLAPPNRRAYHRLTHTL